ncbi:histidinol-phosphate transaminase [Paraferrimonas sedimenticola]|uniref:Histidinol-phosphate aminotransferase n=1 Tax=Paraferrimonas sedimenticola TaxID=375674 RepID=A0AA37RWB3_9GAMM|nr:histidinol-phosphate transaminase [Paraferrimonas sedimenticola]GLP96514.1 histidinol-phosphate aminotransferase [Paraferrimonas sedimenticola]
MSQTASSDNWALALARPELSELVPYQSARRIGGSGEIWLNANESPYANYKTEENRYPEAQPPKVIRRYARYAGVRQDQCLVTRGADEGIELLIRAFCVPGKDSIAFAGPTYGMYAISAETCGVASQVLELNDDYSLPQDLAEQVKQPKLVFVCNPNNPTGNLVPKAQLLALAKALPNSLLVVDEAYIEFCPQASVADEISDNSNLVVLRTLSKAFALAGARIGFTLACAQVIDVLNRVIAPYPIPTPCSNLAEQALSTDGIAQMQAQVGQLNALRTKLINGLKGCGAVPYSAAGNFVLAEFTNAPAVQAALAERGIVIRAYSHPRLSSCLRFSIGDAQQTQQLLEALQEVGQQA